MRRKNRASSNNFWSDSTKQSVLIVVLFILLIRILIPQGEIYIGLVVGLIAWLISFYLAKWIEINTKKEQDQKFKTHHETTTTILNTILNVVQDEYFSFVNKERAQITEEDYDNYFQNALEVKISGIANNNLINGLVGYTDPLIKRLRDKENKDNVQVQVLMSHPKSQFVKIRDYIERRPTSDSPCSDDINHNLRLLEEFANSHQGEEHGLPNGNEIKIILSYTPFDSAITYIKKKANKNHNILLWGPIHNLDLANKGPLYKIPNDDDDNGLYHNCIKNFKTIFKQYKDDNYWVFIWDKEGVHFNKDAECNIPKYLV